MWRGWTKEWVQYITVTGQEHVARVDQGVGPVHNSYWEHVVRVDQGVGPVHNSYWEHVVRVDQGVGPVHNSYWPGACGEGGPRSGSST